MEGSGGLRPEVGMRFQRYGDVLRCTGGNGRKAVAKDAAMNETRNDPGGGLLKPWERN
jgi:hypothetical protein